MAYIQDNSRSIDLPFAGRRGGTTPGLRSFLERLHQVLRATRRPVDPDEVLARQARREARRQREDALLRQGFFR